MYILGKKSFIKKLLKKLRLVSLTFLVLLQSNTFNAYAKSVQPIFDQYTIKDGLSHNTVNCIVQDSLSFLWFGTMDGLNRFDGNQFKVFKSSPNNSNSLCHNLIKSICIDKDGRMWIGTARGLSRLDITSNQFTNYFAGDSSLLSYDNIEMVFCDSKGSVWVATMGGGLNKFNKKTNKFTRFKNNKNIKNSLSNDNVHWVFEDSKSRVWIGTEGGGLNRLRSDSITFDYFQYEPEDGNYKALNCVRSVAEDYKGNIWVGTWGGGTAFLDNKEEQFHYYRKNTVNNQYGVSDNRVISIIGTSNSQMWFGTEDGGLNHFVFEKNIFNHFKMDQLSGFGLKSNNIRAIYEDNNRRIWLGSSGGGVFSFHSEGVEFVNLKIINNELEEIQNPDIYAIKGNDEALSIGTNGAGLYHAILNKKDSSSCYNNIRFEKVNLPNNIVHSLCYDNWGRLWAGTLGGGLNLIEFAKETNEVSKITNFSVHGEPHHTVSYNDIRTIYNDRIGNLWIGTAGGGLDKLIIAKRGEYYFEHYKHNSLNNYSLSNNDIRAICEDQLGNLWIGTSFGLNKMVKVNGKVHFKSYYANIDQSGFLSGNWINSLFADVNGIIWVGTDAGLNRLDPLTNKITVYTEKNGLVNNVIKNITGDSEGNIWISTVNGLSMFNPISKSFYNFYETDGLLSNEFNVGAIYTNEQGQIFVGGTKGLNYFIPKNILKQNQVNAIHLTDFKIFNQSVKVGESINNRVLLERDISSQKSLKLKHNENSFSFEFSALDYSNAEKIKYLYKLKGFNNKWQKTDAAHRFATYTNLGGGKYTFRVKAITGVPKDIVPECSIDLQIEYPIWLRWWSFCIYIMIACSLFYFFRRYYNNKVRFREELKMSKIQREKEQELISLKQRFFMNISHELKTPLTLIMSPAERISKSNILPKDLKPTFNLMYNNAHRLSNLINQLMDFNKLERGVIKLSVRQINFNHFVVGIINSFEELALQKNIKLEFFSYAKNIMAWIDEEKMEKIFFNLLSNAFKYTSQGGEIGIRIESSDDDSLIIKVSDTGKGIEESHQKYLFDRFYQVDKSDSETGTGIGLSLVKDLVTLHHGTITLESKLGHGSSFIINLPLSDENYKNEIYTNDYSSALTGKDSIINEVNPDSNTNKTKGVILIVEDNDDMRSYLNMILKEHYQTITVPNGRDGLEIAKKQMPDVILSDVMMPLMDGVSLCQEIKSDISFCHIPVLLLTAKTGKNNIISGLSSGADDYIEKPFNTDVLLARIQNIIDNRSRIRQQLQKTPLTSLNASKVNQLDKAFLEKIERIVLENLTSTDFSVEELGRQVGMSRTTLYRKIKGLLDITPIEHIRNIRLKEALEIIKSGNSDIANISESVGFKDVIYFRKCFKNLFDVLPEQI